jgi:putative ABC transport system permease protein
VTAPFSSTLQNDIRYALRQLRTAPGFAITAILTLALSIGLAATVFSVFDAVLIRPLPFGHTNRLMDVKTHSPEGYQQPASWPEYRFWRDNSAKVINLAGYTETTANLQAGGAPFPVHALGVTTNFFQVVDVRAFLGRTFLPSEGEHGHSDVAMLSYSLWQHRFGGDRSILGHVVEYDGHPLTVIGIAPAGFRFPLAQIEQIFVPMPVTSGFAGYEEAVGSHWMRSIARLQPGVTREQAQGAMRSVLLAYAATQANDPTLPSRRLQLVPIGESLLGQTSALVSELTLAVLAVLLLGCVNIAGLMLARGLRRERELAVRTALGASRLHLARQLIVEICLLAFAGTLGGFAFAAGLLAATRALLITALDRGSEVHLNLLVFAAALLASLLTLLLAGLLPLRQVFSVAPTAALRSGTQSAGSSRGRNRLRTGFLVAQVALAMLLLTTSALLLSSLHSLRSVNLGFHLDHLLLEEVALTPGGANQANPYTLFYRPLLDKLKATPGVADAAIISMMPLQNYGMNSEIKIAGEPPAPSGQNTLAEIRFVSPEYYKTIGARLIRGRLPSDAIDNPTTSNVIVNQAFVRRFFRPGEDPIGRKLDFGSPEIIVGVTSDLRQDLFEPQLPEFDLPLSSLPGKDAFGVARDVELLLHTTLPAAALRDTVHRAMAEVDPTVPFRPALTMDDVLSESLTMQRLENWLFGAFGLLALILALVGLYGLVSQEVAQSRREIGIRMALGASRYRVLSTTLRRVAIVAGGGVVAGVLLSLASRQLLNALLPVHAAHQLALYLLLACVMELLALWAAWAPARRAASIDPVEVLRAE